MHAADLAELFYHVSYTEMSLDRAIEYIGPDEFVEVTPKNIRMRKRILDQSLRKRSEKQLAGSR